MRQPVPDLLKGFAVIAMIQVHIMEQLARPEIMEGPAGKASLFLGGPFAAPVFMAVMGYLAVSSSKKTTGKLFRGLTLILLGFLLNIGLNFSLITAIISGKISADPMPYLFGADILFLAGFSYIIIGLMERLPVGKAFTAMALSAVIVAITPRIGDFPLELAYLEAFFKGPATWSYFPVFPWMAYPLAGYAAGKLVAEKPGILQLRRIYLLVPAAAVIALAVPAWKSITDLPSYYHHGFLTYLWMLSFLALWVWLTVQALRFLAQSPSVRFLKWAGRNVTSFYIVQWLIIGNAAFFLGRTQYPVQLLLAFLFVTAASAGLIVLYRKMRFT